MASKAASTGAAYRCAVECLPIPYRLYRLHVQRMQLVLAVQTERRGNPRLGYLHPVLRRDVALGCGFAVTQARAVALCDMPLDRAERKFLVP